VIENAQKKGQGSTKNGRDSNAQRRGCKVYGGQPVKAGGIIFRQVGSTWYPGENCGVGTDFTIYSKVEGIVVYDKKKYKPKISVLPLDSEEAKKVIEASHTTKPAEGTVSRKERAREYFRAKRAAKRAAEATPAAQ
jgi:large subunit ribosomal protein L27